MTRVVVDSVLQAKLGGMNDFVVLCDEAGRTIGYYHPATPWPGAGPIKDFSPLRDEDVRELQKQEGGRPLADILRDLRKL